VTDPWGIEPGYFDVHGQWHDTPRETVDRLRVAMGGLAEVDDPPPSERPVWFVRHGTGPAMLRPAELHLEDGTVLHTGAALPPDLPLGYHDLLPDDGGPTTRLIVVPERCAPPPERAAGVAVQLYAARSTRSWGIGDLEDLRTIGRYAAAHGAPFVMTSPLHAPTPAGEQEPSPYFSSSRRWGNPLHIRPADGAGARQARCLNAERLVDRDRVWAHKQEALLAEWTLAREHGPSAALTEFVAAGGPALRAWGRFCALAELHGPDWREWPAELRRPDGPALARACRDREVAERADFHVWLQHRFDEQHASVGAEVPLLHDLAVGTSPGGFDAWLWQDVTAPGVRVGAPPDEFNRDGQDWGLPPFIPWKLRAHGYEPLAALLRAGLRHAAGLRVDHVMGLFRLYWIPEGGGPGDGGYVRYPGQELLDIVALESVRAGAFVVGEDLGTVEDSVRAALGERGVLSYRLAWFEDRPTETWPVEALAAVTTHDLPTLAGAWSGADDSDGEFARRAAAQTGLGAGEPLSEVAPSLHGRIAASPCRLALATLDDLVGEVERPNVPGSDGERPNWSIGLPIPVDELEGCALASSVLDALTSHNRRS
jgi:4-alpha-glucanotransferase